MAVKESIFGIEAPKFVDAESNEVLLDYFVILKDEPDFGTIKHQSIINRHREWVDRGDHWIFEGLIHLFKYENPEQKYLELHSYYKQNVILYKRRDSLPYSNSDGDAAYFRIDKLEPINLKASGLPDVLLLSFVSIETNVSQAIKLYDLGYLMNTVNDNPIGSHTRTINQSGLMYNVHDINWSNLTIPNNTSFSTYTGSLETINGFKAGIFGDGMIFAAGASNNNSIFKDVINATVFIAFKRPTVFTYTDFFLFNHNALNWRDTLSIWLKVTTGTLNARFANYTHEPNLFKEARVTSTERYDDSQWHIVAVVFNRTAKRILMYTDLGESKTQFNDEVASVPLPLTSNLTQQTQIGYWRHKDPGNGLVTNISYFGDATTAQNKAYIGDILIFYSALTKSVIDKYAEIIANRLNINWIRA